MKIPFLNVAIAFAVFLGSVLSPVFSRGQTLGEALDATNLTWTTSGTGSSFGWAATTTSPHNGTSDATSRSLSGSSTSTLQTTLTGPGTLSFWWRNESTACVISLVSGTTTMATFGFSNTWQATSFYLGSGVQTVKWVYSIYSSPSDGHTAYVDGVTLTPGTTAPFISTQPTSQSQVQGLNATFTATAGGTPPLAYQWRENGTNISGATSTSCALTNVQPANAGIYTVLVTNGVDSILSSNASLELGQVTAWGSSFGGATIIPAGATNILAISAGNNFNFLLRKDHSLIGWGYNPDGETVVPDNVSSVIATASGTSHSLALRSDGTVAVWGANSYGQTNMPPDVTNVVAIAAGYNYSLALKADGTVVAWGDNSFGQTNVPPGITNVVAMAGGNARSLALTADGNIVEWGQSAPTGLSNVVAIAADAGHYLALLAGGTVVAWGQNFYGEASVPGGLSNVVAIAAGVFHSLALQANGKVVAWGNNAFGQTTVPPALTNVVAVAAGNFHSLALVGNGPPVLNALINSPVMTANGFSLSVPSQCGRVYMLQYKNSLSDSNWSSLPLVAGNGTNLVLSDLAATNSARCYRVLRW